MKTALLLALAGALSGHASGFILSPSVSLRAIGARSHILRSGLTIPQEPLFRTLRTGIQLRRPCSKGAGTMGIMMGMQEWCKTCDDESGEAMLGCMPFALDDLLLPGEQKQLHLYEARFLALFEEAIKSHGSCIGQLGFFEEGDLAAVAVLCEIVEWRRMDVGVHVRMRAAGRVSIKALMQGDPYIVVSAAEYRDEERSGTGAALQQLADEVVAKHADIVKLTTDMDKEAAGGAAVTDDVTWGHEKTNTSHCFRSDLLQQVRQHQTALAEGSFLRGPSGDEEAGEARAALLWGVENAQLEELQLLSFVALAGLEPEVRLWALDQTSTRERLEKGVLFLTERKKILLAKRALSSLKFE